MATGERVLGLEGGGTKTVWALLERRGGQLHELASGRLPGSNFRLTARDALAALFRELPPAFARAGIFLAGCVTERDRKSLRALCAEIWPSAQIITGSDRDSGVAAALGHADGIVVNAGTGSSVTGRRGPRIENAGGWGHILGDAGGGYYLSVQALRLVLREYDLRRGSADFAAAVLRALSLNDLDALVRWAQSADKMQLAMITPLVFAAAEAGDAGVGAILEEGAHALARYTGAVAQRLQFEAPEVKLIGGLFQCCAIYADAFRREFRALSPLANIEVVAARPEIAAAWLACAAPGKSPVEALAISSTPEALAGAATELPNERSAGLEKMSARQIAELFVAEERAVEDALRACLTELSQAITLVAQTLRNGGRLFYLGAGTSGRLGVLDASEIPPTFGTAPEMVQGIIAGGAMALHRSVEGAEDERGAGALALRGRQLRAGDVVCGIAASGRTPFVLGGLGYARSTGARTILLTCNPQRPRADAYDLEIDLPTGAELVSGSTRLKAGTATKVALNLISTGAMVLLGKVRGNSMIDLRAANEKLRDRAARLVVAQTGCDYATARQRLVAANWNVRTVIDTGR